MTTSTLNWTEVLELAKILKIQIKMIESFSGQNLGLRLNNVRTTSQV